MLRNLKFRISSFCVVVCILLVPLLVNGFNDGSTFIKNFSEKEYNAHAQNHYIAQDKKGIMFFANNDCILNFDGIKWEGISMPNIAHVFAVAVNDKGTVFAAGQNELGYLKYDSQGKFIYVSLIPLISNQKRNFSDIFDIVCVNNLTYFLSEERLFIYDQKTMVSIEPASNSIFRALFKVNNKVYVNDKNNGLQLIEGNTFKQVKNTTNLGELRVKSMFKLNGEVLALTGQNKFIELIPNSQNKYTWLNLPAENDLIVRTAIRLKNGNICVGSKNKGLIIFNEKGEIVSKYSIENGLINNSIWFLYEDLQHNLWVATDKGISFIELSSNIEKIKSTYLSEVNLNSLIYYQNNIFIGTSQSVLKLGNEIEQGNIKKLNEEVEPFHHLLLFENEQSEKQLLAATDQGIVELTDKGINYIDEDGDFPVNFLSVSRYDKNLLLASGPGKIYCYKWEQGKWSKMAIYDIPGHMIISFVEPEAGIIWAGTSGNNFFELSKKNSSAYEVKKLTLNLKKERNTSTQFFYLNNIICVDTDEGIHRYKNKNWTRIGTIQGFPTDTTYKIIKTFETNSNRLWVTAINDAGYVNCGAFNFDKANDNLQWEDKFLKRFYNIQINSICEVNNNLWLASNEGLFYFDLNQSGTGNFDYKTLINNIHIPGSKLYYQSRNWVLTKESGILPEIDYANNQMRFEFTATNYVESQKIKFSSMLIPFDKDYSEWTFERVREFTNLAEGHYTFKVKSLDIYGNIGKEDVFNFTILPPWYRTWWAYILFAILAVILTVGLVRFNTRRLKKQNQLLEATVINRTQEIEEQKNKIEEINREVTDSIRYAQMIQNSILPLAADLKNAVPQSFIFYKPRDIVSGDFYWIHELPEENRIFVAAADCTGHGVPGAFMSMMGMEKLNQSAKELDNISSSLILSYLNREIKLTLGKHIQERELRDGMEIALIDINLKENTIDFAGANRPLWIITPDSQAEDIEVIKPTKAGIAGFTDFNQVFEHNTIKVQPGQTVYLFTDGAIDQFGGPAGKKIMTKGLKNFICSIQSASLEQQHARIATFFEEWQGEHEQVDDILIIGLRLEA